jgi:hypothetical protein
MMTHPLTLLPLVEGFPMESTPLIAQQVSGVLDLVGLAVGIWTLWSSVTLPLGGNLQRAYRLIGFGALAFALSHVLDSFIAGLNFLPAEQNLLLTQGTVLLSMLLFVPGLAGLAGILPTLPSARKMAPLPPLWPLAVGLAFMISAFSFILDGVSPESIIVAYIGLDSALVIIAGLCVFLLLRARIGGVIGRSLGLALAGLLIFSLAHPLQIWLFEETTLSGDTLGILHRLIVMPALALFALSLNRVARSVNYYQVFEPARAGTSSPSKVISAGKL